PEIVTFDEMVSFTSGIVDATGTAAFPGFGDTIAVQTMRPAANTSVTLTPTGFTADNGVRMTATASHLRDRIVVRPDTTDLLWFTARFEAIGTGGTLDTLRVPVFSAPTNSITLKLWQDLGTVGTHDA